MVDGVAVGGQSAVVSAGRGQRFARAFRKSESLRGYALLSPTLIVMALLMCAPVVMMIVMSFWTQTGFAFDRSFSLDNYIEAYNSPIFEALMWRSLSITTWCAISTVVISYPMAYYVAFHVHKNKMLWIILMTLPFWTSYLLRVFAWKIVLGYNGAINSGLDWLGFIEEPLEFLLYSQTAVIITLAHAFAAFAVLPIYVSLQKIDKSLLEASADLGDGPVARFFRVTLPLSMPGVIAALLLIFIPTMGDFVTPALVGGPDGLMMANYIQANFGPINNWPLGAAFAIAMMFIVTCLCISFMGLTKLIKERFI